ncbi:MAG TPA: hypothetical protein VNE39_18585 [Planctomycetota bacterium]|nr:hypothetical protein [Planctomycetota bacterium]
MIAPHIVKDLERLSQIPTPGTPEHRKWLQQEEFLQFLLSSVRPEVLLHCQQGPRPTCIRSVILPESALKGDYIAELREWNDFSVGSWSFAYAIGKNRQPKNVRIEAPRVSLGSGILSKAEPIVYTREFAGRTASKSYHEISQRLVHLHDLHWIEERRAYCRLTEDGDIEEIIRIDDSDERSIITAGEDVIAFHLFATRSVLLRLFERLLFTDVSGMEPDKEESEVGDPRNELFARRCLFLDGKGTPTVSMVRGFQIIRCTHPRKKMIAMLTGKTTEPKEYERFVAWDFKHKEVAECSCDPEELGNYFEPSDKPFGMSPAFFKPDVLLRYKQDPEKYELGAGYISCRGSWALRPYDINDAGQVFTCLVYLGRLPHSEQQHWKQHNASPPPRGRIPERTFRTWFQGVPDDSYKPLLALKRSLEELSKVGHKLWVCPDPGLCQRLNYVVTDVLTEWSGEVKTLDQLVVEGLVHASLKRLARALGCCEPKLGSIKLLRSVLVAKAVDPQQVDAVVSPLEEMQFLRTKFDAHAASQQERDKIRRELCAKHGTLRGHFNSLLERTDKAVKLLLELASAGVFDPGAPAPPG